MANYDLSTPSAIATAAKEVEKERLRLHEVGFQTGKYEWRETSWLSAYGQALKDCAKQLEPLQRLLDSLVGYLGEQYDSAALYRMLHDDMGMTDEEIEFLGFDLGKPDELDGKIEPTSVVEDAHDFGNGYRIQKVFAPEGHLLQYIYDSLEACEREHPDDKVLTGYCVVDDCMHGFTPPSCWKWHDTVDEAIEDYKDNVVPTLKVRKVVVRSWDDLRIKYPMDRGKMTEAQEMAYVRECYELYEKEGLSPMYWSPYEDNAERIGQKVEIIGRCEAGENYDLEVLPMWKARFEDGIELDVYPEEVCPRDMKANGCKWPAHMFSAQGLGALDDVIAGAKEECGGESAVQRGYGFKGLGG